jgi:deoxyadenosine/deoxycytidine kinase
MNKSQEMCEDIAKLKTILEASISNSSFRQPNEQTSLLYRFIGQIIALDGIPCAGKTHLGRSLRDYFMENGIAAVFLEEKMNLIHLEAFYAAEERKEVPNPHAFPLQLCAMQECIRLYKDALWYAGRGAGGGKPHVVIIDRPIWGNRVFEQLHVTKGNITQEQHHIYDSYVVKDGPYSFDHLIYLYTSAEVAHHRILNVRRHPEESKIPLKYLQDLQLTYLVHIYKHVSYGDRSLCIIANDDAYVSCSGVVETLSKCRTAPKVERTLDEIIKAGDVNKVFGEWCRHYAK